MNIFNISVAVIATLLSVAFAQDDLVQEGYKLNPKFPQYVTPKDFEVPAQPENPEVPEFPEYKEPELPEYQKPEAPAEPTVPSIPDFPEYAQPNPSPFYNGHPDFTATQPPHDFFKYEQPDIDFYNPLEKKKEKKEGDYTPHDSKDEENKKEKKEGDYTPHDSKDEEKKKEKKEGDYTPHDSKDEMKKKEKKEGDYTPHDSKSEEEEMEEKPYPGFPVFNYGDFELPKIEEHNFDNFMYNHTGYQPEDKNATDYFKIQESHEIPVSRAYQPFPYYPANYPVPSTNYPPQPHDNVDYNMVPIPVPEYTGSPVPDYASHPAGVYPHHVDHQTYQPEYPTHVPAAVNHEYQNTVEGEGSYYRLDTCEYRFILDMVQCHQEEKHTEKVNVHSQGHGSYHQGQGPYYHNNGYPYQAPYDSRYADFIRLYGNPMYYVDHVNQQSYKPGHFEDSLFSYHPSVGSPFYAPGLHNTPFAKYYAGFRAGKFERSQESERRNYHKEGYYQSALEDFNNLHLQNVVKYDAESESSVKTSNQVSVSDEQGYEGVSPYFNYRVRLLPNHCSMPGYPGRHACIVFSGATHPYNMVHRQFIYVRNTREVKGQYRYRYDQNGQRVQH